MSRPNPQELVRQARRELPGGLVGPRWWSRLEEASASLPLSCHSIFLECHLSSAPGRTDLIARFLTEHRDEASRRGGAPTLPLVESLLARWADPSDSLHSLSFIDVEWDVEARGAVPFVCPTLEPILWADAREIEAARREDAAHQRPWRARRLARDVLRTLYQDAVAEPLLSRLEHAFDVLPPYGCIHYVNYLPQRSGGSTTALRAIVHLPRRQLPPLLQELGFPGELGRAMARIDRYRLFGPWTNIDIDIEPARLGPRLGIYSAFPHPRPTDPLFTDLLRRVSRDRLVPSTRLAALRAWAARSRRSITFKFIASADEEIAVKAYLEIGPEAPSGGPEARHG